MPLVRPWYTTPSMSQTVTFSRRRPRSTSRSRQASAAAPPPVLTSFTSDRFLPCRISPFSTAAATMMAVPCWSSWNTGMRMRSRRVRSTSKHSGALMSSRLMAPEGGLERGDDLDQLLRVALLHLDVDGVDAGELLEEDGLPLHHRLAASAPIAPSPSTAVPFEITATMLPRAV
jgi:hypothetical protein